MKLTRALALGALLAAAYVASAAVAHADDQAAIIQQARRPPSERQVGEAWRHRQAAAHQHAGPGTPRPPLERQVGEAWRHPVTAVRPTELGRPGSPFASPGKLGRPPAAALRAGLEGVENPLRCCLRRLV